MQPSYNIYFLAKKLGDNYLDTPSQYSSLCNGSFHHIVYYYWILTNNYKEKKFKFHLVTELPLNISKQDIVIFYYDTKEKVPFDRCISVQAVGDKPLVALSNFYITHNFKMISSDTFFVNLPLPVMIKRMLPSFPPKNFVGVGALHSFNKEILSPKFASHCKALDINLSFITDKNYTYLDTDVFVFLRDKNLPNYKNEDGDLLHPSAVWSPFYGATHRHANRLYQAWYMNTPLIHNREACIETTANNRYDILYAETPRELVIQMLFLKKNKEYFLKMINNYKEKQDLNNHFNITQQLINMFENICMQ